jgi:hypothetical protein
MTPAVARAARERSASRVLVNVLIFPSFIVLVNVLTFFFENSFYGAGMNTIKLVLHNTTNMPLVSFLSLAGLRVV